MAPPFLLGAGMQMRSVSPSRAGTLTCDLETLHLRAPPHYTPAVASISDFNLCAAPPGAAPQTAIQR